MCWGCSPACRSPIAASPLPVSLSSVLRIKGEKAPIIYLNKKTCINPLMLIGIIQFIPVRHRDILDLSFTKPTSAWEISNQPLRCQKHKLVKYFSLFCFFSLGMRIVRLHSWIVLWHLPLSCTAVLRSLSGWEWAVSRWRWSALQCQWMTSIRSKKQSRGQKNEFWKGGRLSTWSHKCWVICIYQQSNQKPLDNHRSAAILTSVEHRAGPARRQDAWWYPASPRASVEIFMPVERRSRCSQQVHPCVWRHGRLSRIRSTFSACLRVSSSPVGDLSHPSRHTHAPGRRAVCWCTVCSNAF